MNVDLKTRSSDVGAIDEVLEERKSLMSEIKRRLGARSVEEAASKLGMTKSQLDAITRPERSIAPHIAAQLLQALPGLRIPGGVANIGVEEGSIGSWHDRLQTEVFRAVRANPVTSDFDRQVRRLFEQLKRDDYYVLFSFDQKPFEMTSTWFFDQIVMPAVSRGAKFIYVVPKDENLPIAARMLNISPGELKKKIELNREEIPEEFQENLEVCPVSIKNCPFLIPGIKFAFVLSGTLQDTSRSNCIASVSVPIGDNDSIHIPLADSFAEFACGYFKLREGDGECSKLFEAFSNTRPLDAAV